MDLKMDSNHVYDPFWISSLNQINFSITFFTYIVIDDQEIVLGASVGSH